MHHDTHSLLHEEPLQSQGPDQEPGQEPGLPPAKANEPPMSSMEDLQRWMKQQGYTLSYAMNPITTPIPEFLRSLYQHYEMYVVQCAIVQKAVERGQVQWRQNQAKWQAQYVTTLPAEEQVDFAQVPLTVTKVEWSPDHKFFGLHFAISMYYTLPDQLQHLKVSPKTKEACAYPSLAAIEIMAIYEKVTTDLSGIRRAVLNFELKAAQDFPHSR
jgi:hypothetical protein